MADNSDRDKMLQVRLAYRYLFDFHSRLRSSINLFVEQFEDFEFCHADTIYHGRPSFIKNPHSNNTWLIDYFPLMNYSMFYRNGSGNQLLVVQTYCDSGVSDFFDEEPGTDLFVEKLSNADKSKSFLYVLLLDVRDENESKEKLLELWNNQASPDEYETPIGISSGKPGFYIECRLPIIEIMTEKNIKSSAKHIASVCNIALANNDEVQEAS